MDPAELEDRVAALEGRVRLLEDHVELLRLINRWGPAVDTGDDEAAASLWTDDGVLESDLSRLDGPPEVAAMVRSDGQQSLIRQGCAHIQGFPVLSVQGDTAVAVGYSRVYRRRDDGHEVWRVSANRWEFRRTPSGWRVSRRTNHRIDGGPDAHVILRDALG
ncbi:MAG: nuclear transport factor 2 family protein [Acidimicrobiaceae bacterium]|nr:nuclear transport factor 2 family protein [Acidimicrobiaceae bacterium]